MSEGESPPQEHPAHPEHERFVAAERAHRLRKLEELRERGIDPYPPRFDRDRTAAELHDEYDRLGAGEETEQIGRAHV